MCIRDSPPTLHTQPNISCIQTRPADCTHIQKPETSMTTSLLMTLKIRRLCFILTKCVLLSFSRARILHIHTYALLDLCFDNSNNNNNNNNKHCPHALVTRAMSKELCLYTGSPSPTGCWQTIRQSEGNERSARYTHTHTHERHHFYNAAHISHHFDGFSCPPQLPSAHGKPSLDVD